MSEDIRIFNLKELTRNNELNVIIVNDRGNDEITKKIKVSNFLPNNIVKNNNIENLAITNDKIANNTITSNQIACCSICNCNLITNSIDNRIIDNNDNFTFNNVNVTNNITLSSNLTINGNLLVSNNSRIDGRDISADGIALAKLKNDSESINQDVNTAGSILKNGELTLSAAGIAIGTTQTFSANQSNNTCFTITVPNTNLSYIDSSRSLSSSTGNSVVLPIATNTNAGLIDSSDIIKLNTIDNGAEANAVTCVSNKIGDVILIKSDVCLSNVTNNIQIKKNSSSTPGNVPTWVNTVPGNELSNGYGIEETITGNNDKLVTAQAVKNYINNPTGSSGGGASSAHASEILSIEGPSYVLFNTVYASEIRSGPLSVVKHILPESNVKYFVIYPIVGRLSVYEPNYDGGFLPAFPENRNNPNNNHPQPPPVTAWVPQFIGIGGQAAFIFPENNFIQRWRWWLGGRAGVRASQALNNAQASARNLYAELTAEWSQSNKEITIQWPRAEVFPDGKFGAFNGQMNDGTTFNALMRTIENFSGSRPSGPSLFPRPGQGSLQGPGRDLNIAPVIDFVITAYY